MASSGDLPTCAQVVIIGGGIIGASVAYHLVQRGWRDVVLLERRNLAGGATSQTAGLMHQLWASPSIARLAL
ncbi:MAG: FAD-binding oxidoreductase, partial [Acetobacteraceae bacterium]|nr:FAD-binding oxidoreductase [Acetobacteraceae bacterium]